MVSKCKSTSLFEATDRKCIQRVRKADDTALKKVNIWEAETKGGNVKRSQKNVGFNYETRTLNVSSTGTPKVT